MPVRALHSAWFSMVTLQMSAVTLTVRGHKLKLGKEH